MHRSSGCPIPLPGPEYGQEDEVSRLIFERAPIGMLIAGPDGRVERVNPAMCLLLGYTEEELLAPGASITHPDDRFLYRSIVAQMQEASVRFLSVESRYVRKDGATICALSQITAQKDRSGRLVRMIAQVVDLTDRVQLQRRIQDLAYTDPLTRLPNRRALIEAIDNRIVRHALDPQRFAFFFLDLDRFTVINDVLGHTIGDQVLVGVARRVRTICGKTCMLARTGGDEFGLVVDSKDCAAADNLAAQIRTKLRHPLDIEGRSLSIGTSIGYASFPDDAGSRSEVMRNANVALHHAKLDLSGSQRYAPTLLRYSEDWLAVESALQQSIHDDQFEVFVQPVVQAGSRQTIYHEALARWRHDGQLKSPNTFIPIAEADGLIIEIDQLVARKALSGIAGDERCGINQISLNLSAISLRDERIVGHFENLLESLDLPGSAVLLEVTETAVLPDMEHARNTLGALRALGIKIAIDDFGTGYASFSLLRRLGFDVLKIDKSLVDGIGSDSSDENILEGLIGMGHNLGVQVVAEGVECAEQCHWLEAHGCDYLQGFHLGTPRPFC